jgi:WD40 repeat protein
MASGGLDNAVIIWNVMEGLQLKLIKAHVGSVNGLSYCPIKKLLISCSSDKTIKFWHGLTFNSIHVKKAHTDIISHLVYHEPRNIILTASWDKNIRGETLVLPDEDKDYLK